MSTGVERLHRHRARKAIGKAVLSIEVCLADHIELLKACHQLQEWDDHDKGAITRGTERLLRRLAEEGRNAFRVLDFE